MVIRQSPAAIGPWLYQSDKFKQWVMPLVMWQAKKKMLSDLDHLRGILEVGH